MDSPSDFPTILLQSHSKGRHGARSHTQAPLWLYEIYSWMLFFKWLNLPEVLPSCFKGIGPSTFNAARGTLIGTGFFSSRFCGFLETVEIKGTSRIRSTWSPFAPAHNHQLTHMKLLPCGVAWIPKNPPICRGNSLLPFEGPAFWVPC